MKPKVDSFFSLTKDGSKLVTTVEGQGGSDLCIVDLRTRARQTVPSEGREEYPAFADTDRLVYSQYAGDTEQLFLLSMKSGLRSQLTNNAASSRKVICLQDGKTLIFVRYARRRPYSFGGYTWDQADLWKYDLVSRVETQLTNGHHKAIILTSGSSFNSSIFVAIDDSVGRYGDVWQLDLKSRNLVQVTNREGVYSVCVSPDGKHLAYIARSRGLSHWDVFTLDLLTKKETRLTFMETRLLQATYAPDGSSIYFMKDPGQGPSELWKVNMEHGNAGKPLKVMDL